MLAGKRILALIPARGGSKGLPGKNIRPLAGKPLLAWTIEAALGTTGVDRTVVTTDSEDIAKVAIAFKAEAPFLRPPDLAGDAAPTSLAVLHALDWLEKEAGAAFDLLVLLQPTSPFRASAHVDQALAGFLADPQAGSLVSVTESEKSPYWMKTPGEGGYLRDILPGSEAYTRRQDLPKAYALNGAIYVVPVATFRREKSFMTARTLPLVLDARTSVDIDTALDFEFAEFLAARDLVRGSAA